MALQAMWVHGHSVNIELQPIGRTGQDSYNVPWSAILGVRVGFGATYWCQQGTDYGFHFAIPTPVIHNGVRIRLRRVMLLFSASEGVTLTRLAVFDGPNNVFEKGAINVGGENNSLIDGRNSFAIPDREVFWGIGVSAYFHFPVKSNVTFYSAGVDFEG